MKSSADSLSIGGGATGTGAGGGAMTLGGKTLWAGLTGGVATALRGLGATLGATDAGRGDGALVGVGVAAGSPAGAHERGSSARAQGAMVIRSIWLQAPIAMLFQLRTMSHRLTGTSSRSNACLQDQRLEAHKERPKK